ncbi:Helix-turn-helix domain-containing protein [Gracilibacillus ureilyticus]|uniref:Helix-turn-helix domain-containing protein n=1 Tax=Gracilibacillus ureilyticus TaxID=531814 RepID=A0A1H9P4V9_9BACI|nr:helix-turn-helix domain-containing protein [Gracilibacillus ureilyticus]SER42915.1 Helix-turn-helix domain-containing protein [Gracilibacillus ureilyticus]
MKTKQIITTIKNWFSFRWQSNYFRKSFLLILFITSIPGIISGIAIYTIGLSSTENELHKVHIEEIDDRAHNIDVQFSYLEESLTYWAYEPTFNYQLISTDFVYEFTKTRDIMQKLLILEGSQPLIKGVDLYVETQNGPILFSPYLEYINDENEQAGFHTLIENPKHISWDHSDEFHNNTNFSSNLILSHQIPGVINNPFGAIVVTIDQDSLGSTLETLTPYSNGVTLLLDENNELLLSTENNKDREFTKELLSVFSNNNKAERSFQMDWDDKTYSVSYGSFDRVGSKWTYVSAAPISAITTPILTISKVILIASLLVLGLAFLLTWFASNRLYKPVKNLASSFIPADSAPTKGTTDEFKQIRDQLDSLTFEREQLEKRISNQIPQLRQNFLIQLTKGYLYDFDEQALKRRMENYRWKVNDHSFVLLDIQLTGGVNNSERTYEDDSLVAFAMANIAEDVTKKYLDQYTVLNQYDMTASIFLIVPKEIGDLANLLNQLAEDITTAINRILSSYVTITISSNTPKIKDIYSLFEEIGRAKRYRDFNNQNQVLMLNEVKTEVTGQKLFYPFETEKEIVQSIRRGRMNESEELLRQFFDELLTDSTKEVSVHAGMMQLYSTIQHEILLSGVDPVVLYNGRNMYEELSQLREIEWVVKWLISQVIEPYIKFLEENMNMEMKLAVDKVVSYIEEHYMEDISLESCAEFVDITPYTLSKAFKKIHGINFIDYLTTIRMDKAKELLLQTNMKINEISEQVGYRHSYFNRIFKKHVGLPPSQYRKMRASSS